MENKILAIISEKLELIEEYGIENIFTEKPTRSLFMKMKNDLKKGYKELNYNECNELEMMLLEKGMMNKQKNNFMTMLKEQQDNFIKKRLSETLLKKAEDIKTSDKYKDVLLETYNKLGTITRGLQNKSDVYDQSYFEKHFNDILEGKTKLVSDVKTNKYDIMDNLMLGLRENKTTLMSASTGMGKTTFSINVADAVSFDHKVLYINLEMDGKELYNRLLMINSEEPLTNIYNYKQHEKDGHRSICENIIKGHESIRLRSEKLIITNCIAKSVDDIKLLIRKHNKDKDIKLIVIDYLGIIKNRQYEERQEHLKLFNWVKELNELRREEESFHLWIITQLNRTAESGSNVNGRSAISGSYNVLAEVDTFLTLYHHEDLGFILKNGKNRGYKEGWEIQMEFRKDIQTFIEGKRVDVSKYEKEKLEREGKNGFKKNY